MVYFLTVELNCNLKYQSVIAAFNSNQNFKIEIDWISGICKYSAVLVTCNSTWNSLRCIEIMNQVKTVKIFTCLNYSVTRKLSDILIKYFWQIISFKFFTGHELISTKIQILQYNQWNQCTRWAMPAEYSIVSLLTAVESRNSAKFDKSSGGFTPPATTLKVRHINLKTLINGYVSVGHFRPSQELWGYRRFYWHHLKY